MNDSEREQLVEFVHQTQELLDWVINDPRSALPSHLRTPLRDAWEITVRRFGTIADSIGGQTLDDDLDEHGLSGPELLAKLTAFSAYYESWSALLLKQRRRRRRRATSSLP